MKPKNYTFYPTSHSLPRHHFVLSCFQGSGLFALASFGTFITWGIFGNSDRTAISSVQTTSSLQIRKPSSQPRNFLPPRTILPPSATVPPTAGSLPLPSPNPGIIYQPLSSQRDVRSILRERLQSTTPATPIQFVIQPTSDPLPSSGQREDVPAFSKPAIAQAKESSNPIPSVSSERKQVERPIAQTPEQSGIGPMPIAINQSQIRTEVSSPDGWAFSRRTVQVQGVEFRPNGVQKTEKRTSPAQTAALALHQLNTLQGFAGVSLEDTESAPLNPSVRPLGTPPSRLQSWSPFVVEVMDDDE